jgi:hypothetical protein
MLINPLDKDALREQFRSAKPFPHLVIENFLEPSFLREVVGAYPTFDKAWTDAQGTRDAFNALNEKRKVQVSDSSRFPAPVKQLHDALASDGFLADLADITGIENLKADPAMRGGGMHLTGPRGRLDVHIDFNYSKELQMHRRLNILVYLNEDWDPSWGGAVELWDTDVKNCEVSVTPVINRCVLFETSDISFHGVEPVTCPPNKARMSFAGYYYTADAPTNWNGEHHSTVFKARPEEALRDLVWGNVDRLGRAAYRKLQQGRRLVNMIRGRD